MIMRFIRITKEIMCSGFLFKMLEAIFELFCTTEAYHRKLSMRVLLMQTKRYIIRILFILYFLQSHRTDMCHHSTVF